MGYTYIYVYIYIYINIYIYTYSMMHEVVVAVHEIHEIKQKVLLKSSGSLNLSREPADLRSKRLVQPRLHENTMP